MTHDNQVCVHVDRYTCDTESGDLVIEVLGQGCDVDAESVGSIHDGKLMFRSRCIEV